MDAAAQSKNEQFPSRIRPPSRTCSRESRSEHGQQPSFNIFQSETRRASGLKTTRQKTERNNQLRHLGSSRRLMPWSWKDCLPIGNGAGANAASACQR